MSDITFEWDLNKASSNIKKHGIDFDEAQSVFYDVHARIIPDPDSSFDESVLLFSVKAQIIRL